MELSESDRGENICKIDTLELSSFNDNLNKKEAG